MTSVLVQITPEGWVAIAITLIPTYLFADHLAHTVGDYRRHRGARRLRGLMLAILLFAGMLGILMGIFARYVPEVGTAARFIRWISVGMLFVGGITTYVTWRLRADE
jgi:hypothetical protein